MRQLISPLVIIILLAGVLTACAHQPAVSDSDHGAYVSQKLNCESLEYNSPARQHCYEEEYNHHHHNEVAGFFGYFIFRVVVEGIVHALIYH